MLDPAAPQLVVNARMLVFSWLPAEPDAVAALVPAGLRARPDRQVFLNQYEVDDECQTSGFGAYSLTYLGVSLDGMEPPDGEFPCGWWTHYLASSAQVRQYAAVRGAPATPGRTTVEVRGESLVAQTWAGDLPLIRVRARVGHTAHVSSRGHNRYLVSRDGRLRVAEYPYVTEPVSPFEIESVEFLAPDHPTYALRPANPLQICWGLYSPRASFAYPARLIAFDEPAAGPERRLPAAPARSGAPSGS